MMFKSKLATLIGALALAGSSFAIPNAPDRCPNIASVQAEGMSMSAEIVEGLYLTYTMSHFDTEANWVFLMGPVIAESDDLAIEQSNQFLSTVSGNPTPVEDGENAWTCEYDTGTQDYMVLAILTDEIQSPSQLSRFLKKPH